MEKALELDFKEWVDFLQVAISRKLSGMDTRVWLRCEQDCMLCYIVYGWCSLELLQHRAQNMGNSGRQDYKGKSGSDCERSSVLDKGA